MKEYFWFNPGLLELEENNIPALAWHRAWYKLSGMNIFLTDTTGISKDYGNGINIKDCTEPLGYSNSDISNGEYWHKNFSYLMSLISDEVFKLAENKNELRLSYSGGTDSCLVLASLLSNPKIKDYIDNNKFVIYTNPYAKIEDPDVWKRIIEYNLPLRFIDYDKLSLDNSNNLMVTGDGDSYCTWYPIMLNDFTEEEIFSTSYRNIRSRLEAWFRQRDKTMITYDFFNKLIEKNGGVDTMHEAWAIFENACAIQCYMFRFSAYGHGPVTMNPNNNCVWFLNNKNLRDIAAFELKNKMYCTDDSLKYSCLKYISNWMNYTEVKKKKKVSSQIIIPKFVRKAKIYSDYTYESSNRIYP